ncbi:MAG TPA: hypothetical protein PK047_12890 [Saprospiraceae bacterium]|jgi:RNA recognition motif-containing protein|nr:hypothetical protein [Saprospiraceae bacterium]HRO09755.1 hypothetical protein [Saprospiraceae bacterium]HRP43000.1 hypothetical protein [Saprospiraceae bacterium]
MDLYVGSIPFKWKEKDLIDIFAEFGEIVSVKIVIDKITRQNKGFGFITMIDDEAAMKAIEWLNGSEQLGRNIIVTPSIAKREENKGKPDRNFRSKDRDTGKSYGKSGGSTPFWKKGRKRD